MTRFSLKTFTMRVRCPSCHTIATWRPLKGDRLTNYCCAKCGGPMVLDRRPYAERQYELGGPMILHGASEAGNPVFADGAIPSGPIPEPDP